MSEQQKKPKRIRRPSLLPMFIVCFLTVGILFFMYEIIERTLLKGVDFELIHVLHIIRGLSAAAIASVLATLMILRQPHEIDSDVTFLPSAKSWRHRLQNVRLHTKITVPMVALSILPAIIVGIFTISTMQKSLGKSTIQRIEFDTASKAQAIQGFLQEIQQDLIFLSQIKDVKQLVAAEAKGSGKLADLLRQKLEEDFLVFSQGKRAYYQIRYINSDKHEVVRLNIENGIPKIVPLNKLQDKSNRYYINAAFDQDPGQIYISPMDLNVEYGKTELPLKAVVRYATVVSGEDVIGRGLLVVNVHAEYLLSLIKPLTSGTEAWLVNQQGLYLGYVGESEQSQKLFSLEKQRKLSEDYTPEQIQILLEHSIGKQSIATKNAFLSSVPVAIDQQNPESHWTLMISRLRVPLEKSSHYMTIYLMIIISFVVAVVAILGLLIGNYLVKPIVQLQLATRDIADGNLEKHLDIRTGDEIEGLANDFNTMTRNLRDAREHLSSWNLELEREVKRQTEIIQQTQSGMARADKLASIGQITAGVMHEIGNPLAAIKTKIQVAGEDENLCEECQQLLIEILTEIDRLAAFLHSLSRLSRIVVSQTKQSISLTDIANSVINLVSTDFKRKKVFLQSEYDTNIPEIRCVADQLRQLLMNLLINAVEALPDGGDIVIRIQYIAATASSTDMAGNVKLEVVDEGEGIPADILNKIWEPFFTSKNNGTGLGLSICRKIVKEHSGIIRIDSEVSKGTVVTVTFPAYINKK